MKLSDRLETIIGMVKPCRTAADIGCDHGFAAIRLVEDGTAERAVCSDVREGPLRRAEEHIREAGLQERIGCRLGDGLSALKTGEADCILIAGMGGKLTARILTDGADVLSDVSELVLSPHTETPLVRETLQALGFRIEAEKMTEEDGKFYTVIRAVPGNMELTEEERDFGPCLLKERSAAFLRWIDYEIRLNEQVLAELSGNESEAAEAVRKLRLGRIEALKEIADQTYQEDRHDSGKHQR